MESFAGSCGVTFEAPPSLQPRKETVPNICSTEGSRGSVSLKSNVDFPLRYATYLAFRFRTRLQVAIEI